MPEKSHHHFHLRLPEDVLAFLMDEKGDKSLNKEIIGRLRGLMAEDRIGKALRPILDTLEADDQAELVELAIRALEILAKGKPRRRK